MGPRTVYGAGGEPPDSPWATAAAVGPAASRGAWWGGAWDCGGGGAIYIYIYIYIVIHINYFICNINFSVYSRGHDWSSLLSPIGSAREFRIKIVFR